MDPSEILYISVISIMIISIEDISTFYVMYVFREVQMIYTMFAHFNFNFKTAAIPFSLMNFSTLLGAPT